MLTKRGGINMESVNIYDLDFEKLELISILGKEADIFSDYKMVYKIYKRDDINLELKQKKIEILSSFLMPGLILPKQRIVNPNLIGYTMDYVKGNFVTELNFSSQELIKLFKKLSQLLKYYHNHSLILGDVNISNILINSIDDIHFCDVDSCKILDFPNDGIPLLTFNYLKSLGINPRIIEVNENFDNLNLFLIFLYVIFDKKNIFSLSEYDIDKTLEEKQFASQKPFVKQLKRQLVDVPYLEEVL